MIVRCRRDCYDSQARRFYERGKEYDTEEVELSPAAPIAKFFDFPEPAPKPAPAQASVPEAAAKPKGKAAGKPKDDFLA